jgi:predicted metal-binding protein
MIDLREKLSNAGVYEYGIVDPREVEFSEEIRALCEENQCCRYGAIWACPPAVGTVDECRERARNFNTMVVFSGKFDIKDSYDFEGMISSLEDFKKIAQQLVEEVRPVLDSYLMLANEGCDTCENCTYPDKPCRFPDKVCGSITGYGISVSKLAAQAGIRYNNGENTVTYFGALLFNEK